jgi:hypothetical protein
MNLLWSKLILKVRVRTFNSFYNKVNYEGFDSQIFEK